MLSKRRKDSLSYQFLHVGDIFKNLPIESIFKKAQICFEGSHDMNLI